MSEQFYPDDVVWMEQCPRCKVVWYRSRTGGQWLPSGGDPLRYFNRGCSCRAGLNIVGEVPQGCVAMWNERAG